MLAALWTLKISSTTTCRGRSVGASCSVMYQTNVCVFIAPSLIQGTCRPSGARAATSVVFLPWLRGTEPVARWSCGAQPRARVLVYRDWLVGLGPQCAHYVREICRRRRDEMNGQITALYTLAHQVDPADFLAAVERATQQHSYGTEYVQALLARTPRSPVREPRGAAPAPLRQVVERDLAHYEQYVANRDWLLAKGGSQ